MTSPSTDSARRKDRIGNALLSVLAACSIIITGLVVKREFFPASPEEAATQTVRNWREYATGGHEIGPQEGRAVTIVEFSDFQCPSCREMHRVIAGLHAAGNVDFRVLYRHYPLRQIHPFALDAAVASECAADQDRFAAFHDVLFDKQDSIGLLSWTTIAARAGVRDRGAFTACLKGRPALEAVQRDMDAGDRLGVRGTPTILIEDRQVTGVISAPVLQEWVRQKREQARLASN